MVIEQTSLYTVVYKTFLYNPTNLKVPKKAPFGVLCSGRANTPQPSHKLSTAPSKQDNRLSSHMVPALSNVPWSVRLSHLTSNKVCLIIRPVRAASYRMLSRASRLNTHATTQHHSLGCNFPIHFPDSISSSVLSVPYIETIKK